MIFKYTLKPIFLFIEIFILLRCFVPLQKCSKEIRPSVFQIRPLIFICKLFSGQFWRIRIKIQMDIVYELFTFMFLRLLVHSNRFE